MKLLALIFLTLAILEGCHCAPYVLNQFQTRNMVPVYIPYRYGYPNGKIPYGLYNNILNCFPTGTQLQFKYVYPDGTLRRVVDISVPRYPSGNLAGYPTNAVGNNPISYPVGNRAGSPVGYPGTNTVGTPASNSYSHPAGNSYSHPAGNSYSHPAGNYYSNPVWNPMGNPVKTQNSEQYFGKPIQITFTDDNSNITPDNPLHKSTPDSDKIVGWVYIDPSQNSINQGIVINRNKEMIE